MALQDKAQWGEFFLRYVHEAFELQGSDREAGLAALTASNPQLAVG